MRTKNLNLKKKIAFIASVAMIASTAAYLPAEVAKNIGTSLTVNAFTAGAYEAGDTGVAYVEGNKVGSTAATKEISFGQYITAGDDSNANTEFTQVKRNLFKAYVQVNGKYIGKLAKPDDATATNPVYKYFSTIDAIKATAGSTYAYQIYGELVETLAQRTNDKPATDTDAEYNTELNAYQTPAANCFKVLNVVKDTTGEYNNNIVNDLFTAEKATNGAYTTTTVVLPSIVKSTDKVAVKIVGNTKDEAVDSVGVATTETVANYKTTVNARALSLKGYTDADEDSIPVVLDDYGFGQIPAGSTVVEVKGANYDDKNAEIGDKESIDLSGLKFKTEAQTRTKDGVMNITKVNGDAAAILMVQPGKTNANGDPDNTTTFPVVVSKTNPTDILADNSIKSYQYAKQSVNGTYCYTYVAKLNKHIDPGKQLQIDLDLKTGETIEGTGVNDEGLLTLRMGDDGTAKSGVVTVSEKNGGDAVNYTFVVLNGDAAAVALEGTTKFSGFAGLGTIAGASAAHPGAITFGGGVAGKALDVNKAALAYDQVKITSKQEKQTVLKGEKYVQKYTIATNDPVADYSVTDEDDFEAGKRHRGFMMQLPHTVNAAAAWDGTNGDGVIAGSEFTNGHNVIVETSIEFQTMPSVTTEKLNGANKNIYYADGDKIGIIKDTTKEIGAKGAVSPYWQAPTTGTAFDDVLIHPEAGKGANYTTPVLAIVNRYYDTIDGTTKEAIAGYVQYQFTTNYEIPIFNADEKDGIAVDATKVIGYAKVGDATVNGLDVTRPENAKLGGWLFEQFNIVKGTIGKGLGADGSYYSTNASPSVKNSTGIYKLYTSGSNVQAVNKTYQSYTTAANQVKVTPNSYIVAEYKANDYTLDYDANGGYFETPGADAVTLEENKDSNATKVEVETKAGSDTQAVTKANTNMGGVVKRDGYTFKGWNTDPNATTGMSYSAFKKVRPSAKNEKMTLYAIWKAKEVKIEWLNIGFDDKGRSLAGTSKSDFTTSLTDGINANEDASITYKAGEKIGDLPTPTLRGYSFDGWYLCEETINPRTNVTEYSAKAIDKDYVINSDDMVANTDVLNLYAKFKQNSYNVTADYGVGKLTWIKEMESSGSGDDKKWTDTNVGLYSVTDKEYQAGPEEIVEYKYDAQNKIVRFYDGEGNDITDNVSNIYDVRDGSGEYNVFRGFYINGGNTAIAFKDLSTQLAGFSKLEDLTLVAKFEAKKENTKGSMFLDTNGGTFYMCGNKSFTSPGELIEDPNFDGGGSQSKDTHVSSILTVKDNTVRCDNWATNNVYNLNYFPDTAAGYAAATNPAGVPTVVANTGYFIVARPGYTFTGWYTDETCTTKFDFNTAMYEKGVEHKAYAGWKANNTTRYTLRFNLMNANGSFVPWNTAANAENPGSRCTASSEYEFQNTFMGTTDTVVKASEKEIEWNGKTYVYDAKLSANAKTERTIQAEYREYGWGTGNNTNVGDFDALNNGKFSLDDSKYTVIEGIYVEKGKESEPELEAPTAVKVNGNKVTWTGCDAAVKYQIKKVVNGKVSYSGYVETTEATIKNMPTEQFEIAVIAVDKKGNKLASDLKTVTPAASTLEAPTNVKVSDKGVVTWKAAKGAVKYQVLKVAGDSKAYTAKTTELTATLQPTSIDYTVYVIAFDANGKSVRSAAATGKAFASELGTVTDASYDKETATITWTAAKNATKYQICKVVDGKRYYSKYVTTTSYTFTNVPEGNFSYYVIAKDDAGNTTRGTMNKVTNHPSVTDVKLADDNKTVTFKAVEGATGYQLCKIAPGKNPAYTAVFTSTTKAFANACTSGTQVYVLAFFDEAHKDASYSETIIVK